jgi:thioredoxin 2
MEMPTVTAPTSAPARFATTPCPFCGQLNRTDLARLADGPRCGSCRRPLHFDRPVPVSDGEFDAVTGGTAAPILVDFYADWCGPCRMLAPVVDELARERTGSLLVLKVDTDRSPAVAERFGIRGIPTLVVIRDGREVGRHVGLARRAELEAMVGAAGSPA